MRLSIVIPTLDEEAVLADTLTQALELADEVCVSDGGSRDRTVELARDLGARVVEGTAGRGGQLNRGAAAATGDALVFLHADTRLPDAAPRLVRRALEDGAVGGGFQVRFDSPRRVLAVAGRLASWRSRLSGPLGDQAQFAGRAAFDAVGGFPDWPLFEDVELHRRLRRHGRTVLLPAAVTTSARRFERLGVVPTVALNYLLWALFFAGVPPHRLARWYRAGGRA